jgi:GDP-4-dehydro-6-deoxy-D-mannose reductase
VGNWLTRHLSDAGDELVHSEHEIDVTDVGALKADMKRAGPDVVYHLAAKSHVGASWSDPLETLRVNVLGVEGVVEAALGCDHTPRVLMVSSAEVYGAGDGSPLTEDNPLRPLSPYAASKAAAEMIGLQASLGREVDLIRVRPFNHVGPGQSDSFVISALAHQIAVVEMGGGSTIRVGNVEPRRDFTDVRDVVRAYRLLAGGAGGRGGGEVYNICSGTSVSIGEILSRLLALSSAEIEAVTDPALVRAVDIPVLQGDCSRLRASTGWQPEIALDQTLQEMLDWWRAKEKGSPAPRVGG